MRSSPSLTGGDTRRGNVRRDHRFRRDDAARHGARGIEFTRRTSARRRRWQRKRRARRPQSTSASRRRTARQIADGLSRLLADTYTLYLKTHNFHWNVTGPMFQTLHLMFETQYNELALAVDLIAERIRALGFPGAGNLRRVRAAVLDQGSDGRARRRRDDRRAGRGPGSGGAHRARRSSRSWRRRTTSRPRTC